MRTGPSPAVELPERFALELHLGRDGDADVWLGLDRQLGRPVRVVTLGPDTDERRRVAFVESIRRFARLRHPSLADVYETGGPEPAAYAVVEWNGGVSLEDRLAAGDLPNAADVLSIGSSLASALATAHRDGVVHGSIAADSIEMKGDSARLQSGWRQARYADRPTDVAALAAVIESMLVGGPGGDAAPSQLRAELPRSVDIALHDARAGHIDAAGLSAALAGAVPRHRSTDGGWSWNWLMPAAVLATAAVAVIVLGLVVRAQPGSRLLGPATPVVAPSPIPTAVAEVPVATPPPDSVTTTTVGGAAPAAGAPVVWDPFGDGEEHDGDLSNAVDGDPSTAWTTERYFDPLPLLKPGVGFAVPLSGSVGRIELVASPGTRFELRWAETFPDDDTGWERVASGSLAAESITVQLPERRSGWWLIWLVDIPPRPTGDGFDSSVFEVRFAP